MPLLKNFIQPFFPDPDSPNFKSCGESYCNLVAAGDIIRQEFYQTPCDTSIVEDPLYEDITLGAELVTNGTFTGSAAGWTLETGAGGAWAYNTNTIEYSGTDPVLSAFQTGLGLITGRTYRVSFDVTVGAGGIDCDLGLGSGTVNVFNNILTTGTYSVDVLFTDSDDQISFSAATSGSNVLVLDNVSVREVTFASWVDPASVWNFNDGVACKTLPATGGTFYNGSSDYIVDGDYYVVTVDISSYSAGSGSIYIDDGTGSTATNPQAAISANGTYTYYITAAQNGVIGFSGGTTFVGCVSNITVRRLRNDFPFTLIDEAGDVHPLYPTYVTYVENKVLLEVDPQIVLGTDFQCFYIEVIDSCLVSSGNLVSNPSFVGGFTDWTRNNGTDQYEILGGQLIMKFLPLDEEPTKITNGNFSGGTTGWTGFGPDWTLGGGAATHVPGNTTPLSQTITIDPPAVLPSILRYWWQVAVSGWTTGTFTVTIGDVTSVPFGANDIFTNFLIPGVGGSVTFSINPSSNFNGTIDNVAVHGNTDVWSAAIALVNVINPNIVDGNYELEFEIVGKTGAATTNIQAGVAIQNQPQAVTYYNTVGTHTTQIPGYVPGNQRVQIIGLFVLANNYYPGTITVDDISAVRVEPFDATYTSECFNYQNMFSETKVLTAWCDQDSLGSTFEDAIGFETSGIILQMRVNCRSLNPVINKVGNNAFFSDGSSAVKYVQMEKYWVFVTDMLSETALMALGGMISCDHFTIGDSGSEDDTEYLATMEDFTPEWRSQGDYSLATASVTLRKKIGGMKFMRHT